MQPNQSPNQPYDFILNQGQQPKKSLFPTNLSGPVIVIIAALIVMLLIIVFASLFLGKNKASTSDLTALIGQAQEINRINSLEQQNIQDPNTADMLATAQLALTSEQNQFTAYAQSHKVKIDPKRLAQYQNNQTDTQLAAAAQSNSLDGAYSNYLKQALSAYASSLSTTYQSTKDMTLRSLIQKAYISTETLLGNPPKAS